MPSNFYNFYALNMKPVAAEIVPKLLNFEQKQCCMDIDNVINGDESWVCAYDIETKTQFFQWKRLE